MSLSEEEATAIAEDFGADTVYLTRWGEWRTRVKNKRCVLLRNGGCTIHDRSYYPTTCQGFPWVDGDTLEPYEFDQTICGEIEARPELVTLTRASA